MSDAKHTPEPWTLKRWPAMGPSIPESFSIEPAVARIYEGPNKEAYARLITKAPEMRRILDTFLNGNGDDADFAKLVNEGRALLAEIDGQ